MVRQAEDSLLQPEVLLVVARLPLAVLVVVCQVVLVVVCRICRECLEEVRAEQTFPGKRLSMGRTANMFQRSLSQ